MGENSNRGAMSLGSSVSRECVPGLSGRQTASADAKPMMINISRDR